jgi:hypothetical protein
MTKQEVIDRLLPKANELNALYGLHVSMTLAQVINESGWLKHAPGNNFLGIKAPAGTPADKKQLLWTYEWTGSKFEKVQCWFMKYESLEACMDRYAKILLLPRYKQTLESKDWWDSTNYVRLNGYATSPAYTTGLRKTILSYKLYQYDWKHAYNEPIFPGFNFTWGEAFSNVFFNGRKYYRVIEPYPEYFDNVEGLAIQLQIVRFHFAKPMKVESWFRIRDYNSYIGGASQSQHLTANAADVVRNSNMAEFLKAFEDKTDVTGIGIMKNGLHVDRRKGKRIYWTY